MIHSPFKFLDSYTKEDSSIFFGREQETEDLYRKIFENKTLLIYGVSGTGKTSIINCGLANKFNDADWLPVTIRRNQNMVESFYAALHKLSPDTKDKGKRDAKAFIKLLQSVYLDHFKPVYLLFDQFEELFIFGDEEEQKAFVDIIAQIKASEVQVKILFIMREEYLANMSAFEEKIPDLLTNRLRIEKMSTAKVKEAITGPCSYAKIGIENEAVEIIIEKLTRQGKTIELTYLQVLLDRLFHKAAQEQKGDNLQFTQSLVASLGEVSDILGDFLEEQIRRFDNPDQVLDVLKSFVSIRGTKRQSTVEEIGNHLRSLNKAQETDTLQSTIQQLVNLRILREKDENDRYELRHDALAMKIYEKISQFEKELIEIRYFIENARINFDKRGMLLTKDDLKYLAPYEDKLYLPNAEQNLLDKSKQYHTRIKRRNRMLTGLTAIAVIMIAVIYAITSYQKQKAAELQYRISQSKNIAEKALSMMEADPTMAYCLGEAAWKIHPTLEAEKALIKSYRRGPFYESKLPGKTSREYIEYRGTNANNTVKISPTGKYLMINADSGGDLLIADYKGNLLSKLPHKHYPYKSWSYFTIDEQNIVTYTLEDSTYRIWDLSGKRLFTIDTLAPILYSLKEGRLKTSPLKWTDNLLSKEKDRNGYAIAKEQRASHHNYTIKDKFFIISDNEIDFNYNGVPLAFHKSSSSLITVDFETSDLYNQEDFYFRLYRQGVLFDTLKCKSHFQYAFRFLDGGNLLHYADTLYNLNQRKKTHIENGYFDIPLYNNYFLTKRNNYATSQKILTNLYQLSKYPFPSQSNRAIYLGNNLFATTHDERVLVYNTKGEVLQEKEISDLNNYSTLFYLKSANCIVVKKPLSRKRKQQMKHVVGNSKYDYHILKVKDLEEIVDLGARTIFGVRFNNAFDNIALIGENSAFILNKSGVLLETIALSDSLEVKQPGGVENNYPFILMEGQGGRGYVYNVENKVLFKILTYPVLEGLYTISLNPEDYILATLIADKLILYSSDGDLLDSITARGKYIDYRVKRGCDSKIHIMSFDFFTTYHDESGQIRTFRGNQFNYQQFDLLTGKEVDWFSFMMDGDAFDGFISTFGNDRILYVGDENYIYQTASGDVIEKYSGGDVRYGKTVEKSGGNKFPSLNRLYHNSKSDLIYVKYNGRIQKINLDPESIIHDVRVKHVYGKVYELKQKEKEEYGIE